MIGRACMGKAEQTRLDRPGMPAIAWLSFSFFLFYSRMMSPTFKVHHSFPIKPFRNGFTDTLRGVPQFPW